MRISDNTTPRGLPVRGSDRKNGLLDDFEVVDAFDFVRPGQEQTPSTNSLNLQIHPLKEEDAVLISAHPPHEPQTRLSHVPCDIVLVIDVSGSMSTEAPLPDTQDQETKESSGLSILDLTKHAARTVLESLNDGDRLGLVTFSYEAKVIQSLTVMSEAAKQETARRIDALVDEGATNLWAGIQTGLQLFEDASLVGNVQGLYVLTDGMPNHMCPRRGYIPTLKPILKEMASRRSCMPSIHTFGFGYAIRSHLLQSIAEIGDGNYAFIPDAGMIGTVFVHAVANLQSTYATAATLEIKTSNPLATILSTSGIPTDVSEQNHLCLRLGNILFGQSRDIVIQYHGLDRKTSIAAMLNYRLPDGTIKSVNTTVALAAKTRLPVSVTSYHLYRTKLCAFLSSLFPVREDADRFKPAAPSTHTRNQMTALARGIESALASQPQNADLLSLHHDVSGAEPNNTSTEPKSGQIYQALIQNPRQPYWTKWGSHYLPSLLHAHMRQTCNSFKDPGPLRYGIESPLFKHCRDTLDSLFDKLPAPKPSIPVINGYAAVPVSMSRYHNSNNPCFLGSCEVTLPNSHKIQVKDLRVGTQIWNPLTNKESTVAAVVETTTTSPGRGMICQVDSNLWITAYHPILHADRWVFPAEVARSVRGLAQGESIYSILLAPSKLADSHAIVVGGVTCTTLGHGIVPLNDGTGMELDDVRAHPFFGDYGAVERNLAALPVNEKGQFVSDGLVRDVNSGLACGFSGPGVRREHNDVSAVKSCAAFEVTALREVEETSFLITV